MKSFKEWKEKRENINEFFGLGKKPVAPQAPQIGQSKVAMRPGQQYMDHKSLVCPFCNTQTVEKRLDSTHYPSAYYSYQCSKCFKYWPSEDLDPAKAAAAANLIQ